MTIEIVLLIVTLINCVLWSAIFYVLAYGNESKATNQPTQELDRALSYKPVPIMDKHVWHDTSKITYINTDELGMQAAAYAEYETPSFIKDALERRADIEMSGDIPSAFEAWANEESEE